MMRNLYRNYIKRLLDIVISVVALIILSPVLIVLAICVRINLGSPVIFKQKRIGLNEKVFTMYKFRTMKNEIGEDGSLLPDEKRVTRFGAKLRSCGLDELPELINILFGNLSIVGPRPLLIEYLPYYTLEERARHTVRGGLTQPEVLYDKTSPTWDEQLAYEVEYAKNVTFLTDLRIIFKTVGILFRRVDEKYGEKTRKSLIEERRGKNCNVMEE